jgi:hypothetical protein
MLLYRVLRVSSRRRRRRFLDGFFDLGSLCVCVFVAQHPHNKNRSF